jgi:hypothetical protein
MRAELVERKRVEGVKRRQRERAKINTAKAREYLALKVWEKAGKVIPSVEGLALYLGISRQTAYDSIDLEPYVEQLLTLQADLTLNKSLANEFNPAISKMLLSSKHGYIEKSQIDQNVNATVEVGQAKPELAAGFADYMKQQTTALPAKAPEEGEIVE